MCASIGFDEDEALLRNPCAATRFRILKRIRALPDKFRFRGAVGPAPGPGHDSRATKLYLHLLFSGSFN